MKFSAIYNYPGRIQTEKIFFEIDLRDLIESHKNFQIDVSNENGGKRMVYLHDLDEVKLVACKSNMEGKDWDTD